MSWGGRGVASGTGGQGEMEVVFCGEADVPSVEKESTRHPKGGFWEVRLPGLQGLVPREGTPLPRSTVFP